MVGGLGVNAVGEGMCPKRRMHAETRKRYIRGLAAGDGRPEPSFFHLDTFSFTYVPLQKFPGTCEIHMPKRDTLYRDLLADMPKREQRSSNSREL